MVAKRQRQLDAVVGAAEVQYGPAAIRKAPVAEQGAPAATGIPTVDRLLGGPLFDYQVVPFVLKNEAQKPVIVRSWATRN